MLTRLAAVAAILLVAGCATKSPEERADTCRSTDWQRFGLNDGKLGVPISARTDMFVDCGKLGHPVDAAAYEAGRTDGLLSYCTAENGFRVGYEGRRYAGVCPPELESDFVQGFRRGRRERPAYAIYPRIGIGIGAGRDRWYGHPGFYRPPNWCGYWFPHCY